MRDNSSVIAKERLRIMFQNNRNVLDDSTMTEIKRDIGSVVEKYIDVEPENIEIKIILREYKKREQNVKTIQTEKL